MSKGHPARTKLLMKFWSAMHLAGFPKDKEWDAQEKIHIEGLVKLMKQDESEHKLIALRLSKSEHEFNASISSEDERAFRKSYGHSSLCNCIRKWRGKYIVTIRKCTCR